MSRNCHILVLYFLFAMLLPAKNVVFFYALDADWQAFLNASETTPRQIAMNGYQLDEVRLGGLKVYGVKMGAGPVVTAISAQRAVDYTKFELAISAGPVGSLSSGLTLGRNLLVHEVVPWQTVGDLVTASPEDFPVLKPIDPPGDWSGLFPDVGMIRVASGEVFVKTSDLRSAIRLGTDCDAVDMNLYGLLEVLDQSGVPSMHLRVVSDYANEQAGRDFAKFRSDYDGALGKKIAELLDNLPQDPTDPDSYPALRKLFESTEE